MDFYKHIFAGNPLDRGEVERRDENWIADQARDVASRYLPIRGPHVLVKDQQSRGNTDAPSSANPALDDGEPALGWLSWRDLETRAAEAPAFYLGMLDGVAHFTIDLSGDEDAAAAVEATDGYRFEEARSAAENLLSGTEAAIMAQGRAQINWHNRHRFCSVCGHPTQVQRGGQKRVCPACNAEHFPRVDPVIIMVVSDGDRCLLGQSRGRLQAMNRYSALAGFMDQGEAIEEAVAREVMEEAGIRVKNVTYHSSQPWPFPSSLMIGCHAEADSTTINMDDEEMTDVQWFDRSEVLLALEGQSEKLRLPGPVAIAHHIIKAWAHAKS